MKFSSNQNGVGQDAGAAQSHGRPIVQAEVERVLALVRSVHSELVSQASNGLERRVLTALQAYPERRRGAAGWAIMERSRFQAWLPLAAAAALLCVFTGGVFVAQDISVVPGTQQGVLTGSQMQIGAAPLSDSLQVRTTGTAIDAASGTKDLGTASARQKPALPISVGQRRGRANASREANSR